MRKDLEARWPGSVGVEVAGMVGSVETPTVYEPESTQVLRVPGAGRLLVSLSAAWLSFGSVGLVVLLAAHRQTGSYTAAGVTVGAFSFGAGAFAPLRGRLVDRRGGAVLPGQGHVVVLA